jgi:hypothetical protein
MTEAQIKKLESAGIRTFGSAVGVFLATLAKKFSHLIPSGPISQETAMNVINILAGSGLIFFSTTQKDALAEILVGIGAGHVIVGSFGVVKTITQSSAIPTINGLKGGLRGTYPGLPMAMANGSDGPYAVAPTQITLGNVIQEESPVIAFGY